jgi:hypothetical protein
MPGAGGWGALPPPLVRSRRVRPEDARRTSRLRPHRDRMRAPPRCHPAAPCVTGRRARALWLPGDVRDQPAREQRQGRPQSAAAYRPETGPSVAARRTLPTGINRAIVRNHADGSIENDARELRGPRQCRASRARWIETAQPIAFAPESSWQPALPCPVFLSLKLGARCGEVLIHVVQHQDPVVSGTV